MAEYVPPPERGQSEDEQSWTIHLPLGSESNSSEPSTKPETAGEMQARFHRETGGFATIDAGTTPPVRHAS